MSRREFVYWIYINSKPIGQIEINEKILVETNVFLRKNIKIILIYV